MKWYWTVAWLMKQYWTAAWLMKQYHQVPSHLSCCDPIPFHQLCHCPVLFHQPCHYPVLFHLVKVALSVEDPVTMQENFGWLPVRLFAFLFLVLCPLNLISLENAGLTYIGYHHMITTHNTKLFMLTSCAEWFQPHKVDVQESAPVCWHTSLALTLHDVIDAICEHASPNLFTATSQLRHSDKQTYPAIQVQSAARISRVVDIQLTFSGNA